MPTRGFGITLRTEVRNRLEQIAQERGQSLNRVITEVLEAYVESNPLCKLEEVRETAIQTAREMVEAEAIALRSLEETLVEKIEGLRSQKKAHEERIRELRRELLEDPGAFSERLRELSSELNRLERERETLGALLNEAERAFDDLKAEFSKVESKARQIFRQAYEAPALDLLNRVLDAVTEELCRAFSIALRIVGETRALRTVAERIRLMRYVENSLWARVAKNAGDPNIVAYATGKNLSTAFADWGKVCEFVREDFCERDEIPAVTEALRKR